MGGSPRRVTGLDLSNNQLSGTIPAELDRLTSLQVLDLSGNLLSGTIPAELGSLADLQELKLSGNLLSGTIPAELGRLTYLQVLDLSGNQLSGTIPAELGSLTYLQELKLSGNYGLTGCIPDGLEDVSSNDLEDLGLRFCSDPTGDCATDGAVTDAPNNPGLVSDLHRTAGGAGTRWPRTHR